MSSTTDVLYANPYIGARPFRRNERIYGRSREARDLLARLVGDRIVLLNSPSGAGKTSLIQAAIIPTLERRRFVVRPTIRVGAPNAIAGANRYLLSVMQSLEETRSTAMQLTPQQLAELSLDAYLQQRAAEDAPNGQVLIFDQFEEVLTLDPSDESSRLEFFTQLGDALENPWVWALFAIREEYVAALEPYLHLIPTRFANTFRLELLGVEAAVEAIVGPAQSREVGFEVGVAEALAADLAKVFGQDAEGNPIEKPGKTVEPVQLQVVCYRLWERSFSANAERDTISAADVAALGSIDNALEEYYVSGIAKAVAAGNGGERAIRAWIDTQLITRQGLRSQVLSGNESQFGLSATVIDALSDAYLVREERRRGMTWLELAHDRLIAPVRANNTRWFAEHLSPLQRQAEIWAAQGQPDSLLFRDADLDSAETWAAANKAQLTADERLFLENCRAERLRAEERARQAQRIRNLAIGASIAAVLALIAAFTAWTFYGQAETNRIAAVEQRDLAEANRQEAEQQRDLAETNRQEAERQRDLAETNEQLAEQNARQAQARSLAANAALTMSNDPELSLILARQAVKTTLDAGEPVEESALATLYQALTVSRVRETISFAEGGRAFTLNPDGSLIAFGSNTGNVTLMDLATKAERTFTAHADAPVRALAFSPDGRLLATVSRGDTSARIWDVATLQEVQALPHDNGINTLHFSLDGQQLWIAVRGGPLITWDLATATQIRSLDVSEFGVQAIDIAIDGRIAVSDFFGNVFFFDPDGTLLSERNLGADVITLAFNPDASRLAFSGNKTPTALLDLSTDEVVELFNNPNPVYTTVFDASGERLLTSDQTGTVQVWDVLGLSLLLELNGQKALSNFVAFLPTGTGILSGSSDGVVRRWDLTETFSGSLSDFAVTPDQRLMVLGASNGNVYVRSDGEWTLLGVLPSAIEGLALSADGRWLATIGVDGTVLLWDMTDRSIRATRAIATTLITVAMDPQGDWLAVGGDGGMYVLNMPDLSERVFLAREQQVNNLSIHADGTRLLLTERNTALSIIDPRSSSGTILQRREGVYFGIAHFLPDGKHIAAVDGNLRFQLLRADTLEPTTELTWPDVELMNFAVDPAQHYLILSENNTHVQLWDLREQRRIVRFASEIGSLRRVMLGSDTTFAVMGAYSFHELPIALDPALRMAETWITRDITPSECEEFFLTDTALCTP